MCLRVPVSVPLSVSVLPGGGRVPTGERAVVLQLRGAGPGHGAATAGAVPGAGEELPAQHRAAGGQHHTVCDQHRLAAQPPDPGGARDHLLG